MELNAIDMIRDKIQQRMVKYEDALINLEYVWRKDREIADIPDFGSCSIDSVIKDTGARLYKLKGTVGLIPRLGNNVELMYLFWSPDAEFVIARRLVGTKNRKQSIIPWNVTPIHHRDGSTENRGSPGAPQVINLPDTIDDYRCIVIDPDFSSYEYLEKPIHGTPTHDLSQHASAVLLAFVERQVKGDQIIQGILKREISKIGQHATKDYDITQIFGEGWYIRVGGNDGRVVSVADFVVMLNESTQRFRLRPEEVGIMDKG